MSNNKDVGTAIVWTVVSMSRQKAEYLVREFSDEIKKSEVVCRECSRWCHQLQDLSRCALEAVRDHVLLPDATREILLKFREAMGSFVRDADRTLGVRGGRVRSNAIPGSPSESIQSVVASASKLLVQLIEFEKGLKVLLES